MRGPWLALVLAVASGCHASPARSPITAGGLDVDYKGNLRLELAKTEVLLHTDAAITIVPKSVPLERLDLSLGHAELGSRSGLAPDSWYWNIESIDSDRPFDATLATWHLEARPKEPVAVGEAWTLRFRYREAVAPLAGVGEDKLSEGLGTQQVGNDAELQNLLRALTGLVDMFARDTSSRSYHDGGYHVLMPSWPAAYDCGGRSYADVHHPRDCIARVPATADIRIELPAGWEYVTPSKNGAVLGTAGDEPLRVGSAPHLVVAAPKLAKQSLRVGKTDVTLCAPASRAHLLPLLEKNVALTLAELARRLGPYPYDRLVACLNPLPLDYGGLASSSLALLEASDYGMEAGSSQLEAKFQPFFDSDVMRMTREATLAHELAHHWWRKEMPALWDTLLDEGLATRIAFEYVRSRHPDASEQKLAWSSAWADAARHSHAGFELESLRAYLNPPPNDETATEWLAPYVLGDELVVQLATTKGADVDWGALRTLAAEGPAVAWDAEGVVSPLGRVPLNRLRKLIDDGMTVRPSDKVDVVAMEAAFYDALEGPMLAMFEEALPERRTLGTLLARRPNAPRIDAATLRTRYRSTLDVDAKRWLPIGELARLSADESCSARPDDAVLRITCRARVPKGALPILEAYMALDDVAQMRATNDEAVWRAFVERKQTPEYLHRQQQRLLAREATVKHDEPARWKGLSPGKARVQILFHRLLARWAAQARAWAQR